MLTTHGRRTGLRAHSQGADSFLAKSDQSEIATVIKFTLDGDVFWIEPMQVPEVYDSVSTRNKAVKVSSTNPKGKRYIPEHAVDGYPETA